MNKQIERLKTALDALLAEDSAETDWLSEKENLLNKIKFYQHERLVHLIVTMTMSLLTVIAACALFSIAQAATVPFALLFILLLALTAAYLAHYYKLENNVQELYRYYDKLNIKGQRRDEHV